MKSQIKWAIMKRFALKNKYGFTSKEVAREFPGATPDYLARILSDMARDGMLCKTGRHIYHIIPLHKDPEVYVPDARQIAKCFVKEEDYYFGYITALSIYDLDKLPRIWGSDTPKHDPREIDTRIYMVTKRYMHPSSIRIGQTTCHFTMHNDYRFFGYDSLWINHREKAMVSDLEKTIVDAATKPHYCGGILMVGNALYQAKDRINKRKLFYYLSQNKQESAKRRFLYLTNILDMEWTDDHERMTKKLGPGLAKLEPSGPKQGKRCIRFGLIINMDPDTIYNKVRPRRISPEEHARPHPPSQKTNTKNI